MKRIWTLRTLGHTLSLLLLNLSEIANYIVFLMKLFVFLFAERENVATNDALDSEVFKFSVFANF
jgi:hypothetical protein